MEKYAVHYKRLIYIIYVSDDKFSAIFRVFLTFLYKNGKNTKDIIIYIPDKSISAHNCKKTKSHTDKERRN